MIFRAERSEAKRGFCFSAKFPPTILLRPGQARTRVQIIASFSPARLVSARKRHFSLFSRAKVGASATDWNWSGRGGGDRSKNRQVQIFALVWSTAAFSRALAYNLNLLKLSLESPVHCHCRLAWSSNSRAFSNILNLHKLCFRNCVASAHLTMTMMFVGRLVF